jgi:putative ATP-binding cassette transporter
VFANCIVIVVCLGYLVLLSWQLFFVDCDLPHIGSKCVSSRGAAGFAQMRGAREQMNTLHRCFRSLLGETKELQLNSERGRYFVEHVIASFAQCARPPFVSALTAYSLVANSGAMLVSSSSVSHTAMVEGRERPDDGGAAAFNAAPSVQLCAGYGG